MTPLPTVLIPGLYATPALFAAQLPALWRHGPVMVADHTRSSSFDAIVDAILASAPPRFALAGLSMGGALALGVVRAAPERVERLALLGTTARPDDEATKAIRMKAYDLLRDEQLDAVADASFPIVVHPSRHEDEALRAVQRDMLRATGAEAAIREILAYMDRPDARPALAAITAPTMILVGDGDRLTPPEVAEELAAGIPGSLLQVIPECGHLSALEQPDVVRRWLTLWKAAA
jgi:pimeloyl-ACP methyl ester carboxylesterase